MMGVIVVGKDEELRASFCTAAGEYKGMEGERDWKRRREEDRVLAVFSLQLYVLMIME